MCGIVGYVGRRDACPILIKGLHRLEYRGYDSAGVALVNPDGRLNVFKCKGKVSDLEHFLDGKDLGGNIGTPLFDRIPDIRPEDFAVLELSSFQLHSMHCAPDVAIITNISPNHLDVHPDFEDYVSAKCSIYRGQRPDGCLVLNAKDAHTPRFAAEAPGHVRYFSSIGPVENGVYCADGVIYRAHDGKAEKILDAAEIRIPGAHNVENYMAAFAATDGLVGNAACVQVAHTFSGVPHRMERIRELNGITFINDSIASSPTRTIAGLHALPKPPVIILGGHDKHIPFDTLGDEVCLHAKAAVVVGETAQRIASAIRASKFYDPGKLPLVEAPDFRAAVETAYGLAQPGDIVTLSRLAAGGRPPAAGARCGRNGSWQRCCWCSCCWVAWHISPCRYCT